MKTYIRAVREKKYSDSEEITVMEWLDFFLINLAAVTPAIPFPMMTILCDISRSEI
jgi:hypothetical protein